MPQNKAKFLIPAVGAALVLGGVGVATYLFLKGGPSGNISDALGSAKLVPDEAIMTAYISTDPSVWSSLEAFGTPEAQKLLTQGLEDFKSDFTKDSNLSYEKDLKPWLGGVMFAVLPPNSTQPAQSTSQSGAEPNLLMVIGVKDKLAALEFSKKFKSQKNVKITEIDYKGEKITETIKSKAEPNYSTILNDRVIFGINKQSVQQAIDTYKGEASFASKPGADKLFNQNINLENTLVQVYVPDYAETVKQLIATNPSSQIPPQTLEQLKQVKSMVGAIGVDDVGIRMKATANLDAQITQYQYPNSASNLVNLFPVNTILSANGKGLKDLWSAFVKQSDNNPEFKQTLQQTRTQLQSVNIDLDKDIFGWMDGEFALALIPANQGVLANTGFGGALVFDTSDRKTAQGTLDKINNIAQDRLPISIGKGKVGDQDVTQWQIPGQGALVTQGWLDNDTVFMAVGDSVAKVIATPKDKSLKNSNSFQAIAGSLQQPNSGYFYLNMDESMKIFNRFAGLQPIPKETRTVLNSIRGVGMTANNPDKTTSKLEFLLALKRKNE